MKVVKKLWDKWLGVAKIIGNFQSQVIFSIFYLVLLFFVGIVFRFTDPLNIKPKKSSKKKSNFSLWEYKEDSLINARKQF